MVSFFVLSAPLNGHVVVLRAAIETCEEVQKESVTNGVVAQTMIQVLLPQSCPRVHMQVT